MRHNDAVVTLWFVSTQDLAAVLKKEPKADRGFGRKYLAQLNPKWPIAVFGQFPLNRSVQVSRGEFYVAGYPGVAVVQTLIEDLTTLSELSPRLLNSISATEIFAFATNPDTGFGGFARWKNGQIKRSFCALRDRVYEDIGLPEPFENPFWAGERGSAGSSIDLPFAPIDLVSEAETNWLGVEISEDGPDLDVVGYAVDGRKEPRITPPPRRKSVGEMVDQASSKLGLGPQHSDYDDYEAPDDTSHDFSERLLGSASAAKRFTTRAFRRAARTADDLRERLKHTDRP